MKKTITCSEGRTNRDCMRLKNRQMQTDRHRESTIQWGTAKPRGYVSESRSIYFFAQKGEKPFFLCIFAKPKFGIFNLIVDVYETAFKVCGSLIATYCYVCSLCWLQERE